KHCKNENAVDWYQYYYMVFSRLFNRPYFFILFTSRYLSKCRSIFLDLFPGPNSHDAILFRNDIRSLFTKPLITTDGKVSSYGHLEIRPDQHRSEEHTSELQSRFDLVCRLLLE